MRCPIYSSNYGREFPLTFAYLVIAGRCYLLARPNTCYEYGLSSYRIIDPKSLVIPGNPYMKKRWRKDRVADFGIEFGKELPFLIDLSRKVGAPVFVISSINYRNEINIFGQCPILSELGVPSVLPPEQVYQDIAYFVGNTLHPTPDTHPPVEVSNRQKILKAGFDLIKSFRHRKG